MIASPLLPSGWLALVKGSAFYATVSSTTTAFGSWLVAQVLPPDTILGGLARAIEQPAVWVAVTGFLAHLVTKHYENKQQQRSHDRRLDWLTAENASLHAKAARNAAKIEVVARSVEASPLPVPAPIGTRLDADDLNFNFDFGPGDPPGGGNPDVTEPPPIHPTEPHS